MKQTHTTKLFFATLLLVCASVGAFGGAFAATPTLANVTATPTANAAVVTWDANQTAYRNAVEYGWTSALGTNQTSVTNSTSMSVTLSSLVSNHLYYYKVFSCDALANCTNSSVATFTTACSDSAAVQCDAFEGLPAAGSNVGGFITGLLPAIVSVAIVLGIIGAIVLIIAGVGQALKNGLTKK